MFINQIDETFDDILNKLYNNLIKSNLFDNLKNKKNFIKNFNLVNDFIKKFIEINITKNKIFFDLINFKNNSDLIKNKLSNYIYIYIILLYGYFETNYDDFINSLIQLYNSNKSNDFFNPENNFILQNCYKIIHNIIFTINNIKSIDDDK